MGKLISLALISLCFTLASVAHAEAPGNSTDWPRWRGPAGDGHSTETAVPVTWDESAVTWKTTLKGTGQSSPIVWGDHIYLTSALENGKQRLVMCVDRKDGKVLWEQVAWTGVPEAVHKMNTWATPTCCTDGERVYASFGKAGVHCFTADGKRVWSRELGEFGNSNKRGVAASPVLVGEVLIFNGDSETDPFLFGLNKMTGETVWKVDRPRAEGYSTPIVVEANGREELVLNGDPYIAGYEPATGKKLWSCKSFKGRGEPTPAFWEGVLYVVNGLAGDVYAVKPGGTGDVTKSQMVWHTPRKEGRDQPSPIVVNDVVVVSNMEGSVVCYDAKTGKQLSKQRMGLTKVSASPVAAGGKVYFQGEDGKVAVLEPGKETKIVATNAIGPAADDDDPFRASPAISRGQIFLRSHSTLYCIGKEK